MQYHEWLAFAIVLPLCGGCSSRPATVSLHGEVSFDGRAVERGRIDFIPIDKTAGPSAGAAIANGRYAVPAAKGVLPDGMYEVRITAYRKTGRTEPNRAMLGGPPLKLEENFIPAMYNSQSTLQVRVADLPDKSKVDFLLGKTLTAPPR